MPKENIKARKIRRSNIPKDKVVYQVVKRFKHKPLILLFFGLLMLFKKVDLFLIFTSLILMFVIMSLNDHLIFEVRDTFLVSIIDKDYANVVYYDEIINYRFIKNEFDNITLAILTKDEAEIDFVLNDVNVVKSIDGIMGDKRVGK